MASYARPRIPQACGLLAALLAATGCATERTLAITSSPPGAEVRLDDRPIGRTPLRHAFLYYGDRRLTLQLEGCQPHTEVIRLDPPWYARFPADILTEVLVPVGWKDEHRVHAELRPDLGHIRTIDIQGVLERADTFRRAGPEGPRPPADRP